ncbi:MerR family transcriptional regulator [Candidatus Dependentiae bacterium]|nr:MerR family transcriptional regulator [Candidatus Dependentiae bacterium]
MKMSKREYRIGDLAKHLNIEKFVIRFWEKELQIKPKRSKGGQRFYQESDFQTFLLVKDLLYHKKYTIAGAKNELSRIKKNRTSKVIPTKRFILPDEFQTKLLATKKYLLRLKNLLHILSS